MSQTLSSLFLEWLYTSWKSPTEEQIIDSLVYTVTNDIGKFKAQTVKILLSKAKLTTSSLEKIERILENFLQDKTIVIMDRNVSEIEAVLNYIKP